VGPDKAKVDDSLEIGLLYAKLRAASTEIRYRLP
jgi:hypothetical protein